MISNKMNLKQGQCYSNIVKFTNPLMNTDDVITIPNV